MRYLNGRYRKECQNDKNGSLVLYYVQKLLLKQVKVNKYFPARIEGRAQYTNGIHWDLVT